MRQTGAVPERRHSLPSGMFANVTWCESAGNSHASNFQSIHASCRYFGLFCYKQREAMRRRFDKHSSVGEMKSPQRSNYLPLLLVGLLCRQSSILTQGFSCKPIRAQGCHPEGQCDHRLGQLRAYSHETMP